MVSQKDELLLRNSQTLSPFPKRLRSCNSCRVLPALPSAWFAASRRRFRQQFLDDGFDVLRLQADRADNAFAVNDGVGGIIMHRPGVLGLKLRIAGDRVFNAVFLGVGGKIFLSALVSANADDHQTL